MKTIRWGFYLGLVCSAAASFSASGASDRKPGAISNYSADIAVFDRVLATAKPTDRWVKFGDVGIPCNQLKIYRDRLAGKLDPARDGQSVNPNVVTPAGLTFKWPNGDVYYRFDPTQVGNGTITAIKMLEFRDSVAEWAAFANLHFIEVTTPLPTNYITVQEDPASGGGFSSSVGMFGGEQFVVFGPNAWNRGTICHEVGHALGLWHEQQRPDRDTYVTINFDNIHPNHQPNFAIIMNGQTFSTAYDFFSVMHYARNTFALNPIQDTISMKPGYTQFADIIGKVHDRTLSKIERAGMAAIYGAPATAPGSIVTNTRDSGPGSLRTAIYFAFDKSPESSPTPSPATPTTITFNIPTNDPGYNSMTGLFSIKPTFLLPALGKGTTIDGNSLIILDGSNFVSLQAALGLYAHGLVLRTANCTIKGLTITNFNQSGIFIFQGTDPNGFVATGNVIGGTTAAARNIISGNADYGILLRNSTTTGNSIEGNYIGTNRDGSTAQPNGIAGLVIDQGAHDNTVSNNVLSGNMFHGVFIGGAGSNSNLVQGNYIGTNAAGTAAIANATGIEITAGAQSNIVGGTSAAARNVISGNTFDGISINGLNDITAVGTRNNVVQGNHIGLNAAGTGAVANHGAGVDLFAAAISNTIGGLAAGAGNAISGNQFQGIVINGSGTNNNIVRGNIIGLNGAGTAVVQNGGDGIGIYGGAQSNTIGGTTVAARNLISGNQFSGVAIGNNNTSNNLVQGNYIGLDIAGTTARGNSSVGVGIFNGAQSNIVGGTAPGARNVISSNNFRNVNIEGANTNANVVAGNFIGLDATGTAAVPGTNNTSGVGILNGAQNNTVGGTSAGARNLICGHNQYGMFIADTGTTGNLIQGNTIGLNVVASAVPNAFAGVAFFNGAQANTLGGSTIGASNVIAGNSQQGVALFDASTMKNKISQNSIFSNQFDGISLFSNSNNNQPAPTITSAVLSPTIGNSGGTDIGGNFSGSASTIEFFASPPGGDEGQFFIGSANVAGAGNFAFPLSAAVPANYVVTATATDVNGNTSRFSFSQTVTATDSDSDGIPDNWMLTHFSHATGNIADKSRAIDDADGDGLTNGQEFHAGTDPKSSASRFAVTSIDQTPGSPRIGFQPVAGKSYRVDYRESLNLGSWVTLVNGILAPNNSVIQITDPSGTGLNKRFYRVSLEP